MLDQLHRGVESADANDAIPVADVAVVEHQVGRGCVVADIADVWVGSCWYAVHRQPPRKCRNLLDLVEVFEGQGQRQLGGEVACGCVVGQSCGVTVSAMVILIGVSSTSMTLRQILPGWDALSAHHPTEASPAGRDLREDMDVMVRLSSPYDAVLLAGSLAALRMSRSQLASNEPSTLAGTSPPPMPPTPNGARDAPYADEASEVRGGRWHASSSPVPPAG